MSGPIRVLAVITRKQRVRKTKHLRLVFFNNVPFQ